MRKYLFFALVSLSFLVSMVSCGNSEEDEIIESGKSLKSYIASAITHMSYVPEYGNAIVSWQTKSPNTNEGVYFQYSYDKTNWYYYREGAAYASTVPYAISLQGTSGTSIRINRAYLPMSSNPNGSLRLYYRMKYVGESDFSTHYNNGQEYYDDYNSYGFPIGTKKETTISYMGYQTEYETGIVSWFTKSTEPARQVYFQYSYDKTNWYYYNHGVKSFSTNRYAINVYEYHIGNKGNGEEGYYTSIRVSRAYLPIMSPSGSSRLYYRIRYIDEADYSTHYNNGQEYYDGINSYGF